MRNTKNNNKGQVLVLVALSLVVFLGSAALAIDVAYFYHTKHQLQGAADAAALAGASRLRGATDVSAFGNHSSARRTAWKFACKNLAAGEKVYLDTKSSLNCDNPPASTELAAGDIVVGHWNGSDVVNPSAGEKVDAVKVRARRTSASSLLGLSPGGPVNTFFGRIFGVGTVDVAVTAVAARVPAPITPIAVNEYWLQLNKSMRPYDDCVHEYPRSFVRKTTVGNLTNPPLDNVPSNTNACGSWGRTFAILGSKANDNVPQKDESGNPVPGSQSMNGYVNMNSRSHNHDGSGKSWGDLDTSSPITMTCISENCSNVSAAFPNYSTTKNQGSINSEKYDESLEYLHKGYPENYLFPSAVKEVFRAYPISNYVKPTSSCPFATLAFFQTSGNQPINKTWDGDGKKFYEVYPKGKKLVALVYDGTFSPEIDPSMPNTVTVVGYVLLEIDGYADENPATLLKNPNFLGDSGSTAYGHALSDIVEPTSTFGTCENGFFDKVKDLQNQAGSVRLVK